MVSKTELAAAYHKVSGSTLDAAGQAARDSFLSLGSWREDDIERYISKVVPVVANSKRNMANYATNFYSQIAAINGQSFTGPSIQASDLATEVLRNGVDDSTIWARPFKTMWGSLSEGNDFSTALDDGARRAVDLARTDVQLARRNAGLMSRNANDKIVGYLRTLSGAENCALCYVASTQRYRVNNLLPIHPGCDCGEMPIYGQDDPGQIIDQIRLDATHQAVDERFGIADRGARAPDYRKITIQAHGELGPVLTVRGNNFTKLARAATQTAIKAPKAVRAGVKKTFNDRIAPKLSVIHANSIVKDIADEHAGVSVSALRGPKKIQVLGPKTKQHLEDVKRVGKDIDDEIGNRVKKEISDLADPVEIAKAQKAIDSTENLLQQSKVTYEASLQKSIADELAKLDADINARFAELQRRGTSQEFLDDWLGQYTDEFRLTRATREADTVFRRSPAGKKLVDTVESLEKQLVDLKETLPANMLPGTARYNQIYAAKAQEVLAEVRELGQGGPVFSGSEKLTDLIADATKVYPNTWLDAAEQTFGRVNTINTARGYWGVRARTLAISFNKTNGFANGYRTAVHELGHMFEDSVPGLKELQFAFAHERAALNPKRTNFSSKEKGFADSWRMTYSGKDYGYEIDSNYEIFTTGVESIFAGGDNFLQPTNSGSIYKNSSLGSEVGLDEEFRQFILGVLFSL